MSPVRPFVVALLVTRVRRRWRRRLASLIGRGAPNEIDLLVALSEVLNLTGTVVDVGARFGTAAVPFARAGHEVLAFEPDPANQDVLRHVTRWLPSIRVDPRAVSDESRSGVHLFVSPGKSSLSSLVPFDESHRRGGTVDIVTLREALEEHQVSDLDVLKVDAEGNDLKVLRGFDWERVTRPKLVMCEFDGRKVPAGGHTYEEVTDLLANLGYRMLISEWHPVLEYGTSDHRWRCVEWFPHALHGPLSHGNIIGIDPSYAEDSVTSVIRAWRASMS